MLSRFLRLATAVGAAALLAATPVAADSVGQHPRVRQAIQLLDIWFDAQRDFGQIPGLSVAVVHDQEVVWKRAFGFADVEKQTPAKTDTIYSICSISKVFTALAVMQQRDAGQLRLDDPVAKHLPWFTIGLPTDDPMAGLTKWKEAGEHTFRRVRKDETLAESIVFEVGEGGTPARVSWHNNILRKVK